LRRLLYCGEWISSHVLHIYLLHAPDFLGYHDAISLTTNRLLLAGLAFEIAFTAAVVYLPPLQGVFGTAAPPGWVLAMMLPFTVIVLGRRRALPLDRATPTKGARSRHFQPSPGWRRRASLVRGAARARTCVEEAPRWPANWTLGASLSSVGSASPHG
jgi:hypothetical protein